MELPSLLRINDDLFLPRAELEYRATRAGGPGGQHVNTSSTRVELTWSVRESSALTEEQRQRILEKLANRIDQEGVLHLTDAGSRSQHQNREEVTERLQTLVREALVIPKKRKKTRPTRASREKRKRAKRHRAEVKRMRGSVRPDE